MEETETTNFKFIKLLDYYSNNVFLNKHNNVLFYTKINIDFSSFIDFKCFSIKLRFMKLPIIPKTHL